MALKTISLPKEKHLEHISHIQQLLIKMRESHFKDAQTRKELYQNWAIHLESLLEQNAVPLLDKHEICSYIIKTVRNQGATLEECQYVYNVLPTDYKRSVESSRHLLTSVSNQIVEESRVIVQLTMQQIEQQITISKSHFRPEEIQDYYSLINKQKHELESYCKEAKIQLIDEYDGQSDLFSQNDPFAEAIHMDRPEPTQTNLSKEWIAFGKDAIKVGQEIEAFPPIMDKTKQDREIIAKGIESLRTWRIMLHSVTDKKWRSSWVMWKKHIDDALTHGLHASMSLSKLETNVLGTFRGITREQIDSKALVCFKYFERFAMTAPGIGPLMEWYANYAVQYRRGLSTKLHEKLSHTS